MTLSLHESAEAATSRTVSVARARVALARAIHAAMRGGDMDLVTAAMRLWQQVVADEVVRLEIVPAVRPLFYQREALLLSAEVERLWSVGATCYPALSGTSSNSGDPLPLEM